MRAIILLTGLAALVMLVFVALVVVVSEGDRVGWTEIGNGLEYQVLPEHGVICYRDMDYHGISCLPLEGMDLGEAGRRPKNYSCLFRASYGCAISANSSPVRALCQTCPTSSRAWA